MITFGLSWLNIIALGGRPARRTICVLGRLALPTLRRRTELRSDTILAIHIVSRTLKVY